MKMGISKKLFLGFMAVICLNLFFLIVTQSLDSLNGIVTVLRKQNVIKNNLLRVSSLHASQARSLLIFQKLQKEESAEKFIEIGTEIDSLLESTSTLVVEVLSQDNSVDPQSEFIYADSVLSTTFNTGIKEANLRYQDGVDLVRRASTLSSEPFKNDDPLTQKINTITNDIDQDIRIALQSADSLLETAAAKRIEVIENEIGNIKKITVLIILGMIVVSILFAVFFSINLTVPIKRLQSWTAIIGRGEFNLDTMQFPSDEIGELADAFYHMTNQLRDLRAELEKKSRLAAIGEIVASINHEINNPLMVISGNAEFLELTLGKGASDDVRERIRVILRECQRISVVNQKLRDIKNPVVEDYTAAGEKMINLDKATLGGGV